MALYLNSELPIQIPRASQVNMKTRLLLVVPCFNEAKRFNRSYWKSLAGLRKDVDILFVDDGSTDLTPKLLIDFCEKFGAKVHICDANNGKSEAVRIGMLQGFLTDLDDSHVGFIDADGAFNEKDFDGLIGFALRSDKSAVFSSRVALLGRKIDRNVSRHYIGRILSSIISFKSREIPYDSQAGFKIFKVDSILESCLREPFKTRWFFDLELFFRLLALHGDSEFAWEYPLSFWSDIPGSKIKGYEIVRIAIEIKKITGIARKAKL